MSQISLDPMTVAALPEVFPTIFPDELLVSPHGKFAPTSIQLDRVRPQSNRVTYRDYSLFIYSLRYKITGGEKTSKSLVRTRNRKFIVGANSVGMNLPWGEIGIIHKSMCVDTCLKF